LEEFEEFMRLQPHFSRFLLPLREEPTRPPYGLAEEG
jgi:hypothetical protein